MIALYSTHLVIGSLDFILLTRPYTALQVVLTPPYSSKPSSIILAISRSFSGSFDRGFPTIILPPILSARVSVPVTRHRSVANMSDGGDQAALPRESLRLLHSAIEGQQENLHQLDPVCCSTHVSQQANYIEDHEGQPVSSEDPPRDHDDENSLWDGLNLDPTRNMGTESNKVLQAQGEIQPEDEWKGEAWITEEEASNSRYVDLKPWGISH